jgi:hypothetical protein
MKKNIILFGLLVAVAACGDDPTGSTGDKLTRSEAMAIAQSVDASGAAASIPTANVIGDQVNSPPGTVTTHQELSFPCPVSGRISSVLDLSITFDLDQRNFGVDTKGSLKHDHCAFVHEGVTLNVTGAPDLNFTSHAEVKSGLPSALTSSAKGAFDWTASDGRTGHCVIDIKTTTDFSTKKRTTQGEVCGFTVNETTSWT